MNDVMTVFLSGIGGVFIGMSLLYFGIIITPFFTKRLEERKESK